MALLVKMPISKSFIGDSRIIIYPARLFVSRNSLAIEHAATMFSNVVAYRQDLWPIVCALLHSDNPSGSPVMPLRREAQTAEDLTLGTVQRPRSRRACTDPAVLVRSRVGGGVRASNLIRPKPASSPEQFAVQTEGCHWPRFRLPWRRTQVVTGQGGVDVIVESGVKGIAGPGSAGLDVHGNVPRCLSCFYHLHIHLPIYIFSVLHRSHA